MPDFIDELERGKSEHLNLLKIERLVKLSSYLIRGTVNELTIHFAVSKCQAEHICRLIEHLASDKLF